MVKTNNKINRFGRNLISSLKNNFSVSISYRNYKVVIKFLIVAIAVCVAFLSSLSKAEVFELQKLVSEAKGYKLIYKLNPMEYASKGYLVDNSERFSGTLKKIGYLLKLTNKHNKIIWVFVSMNPFAQDLAKVGIPNWRSGIVQQYVNNLEVYSNSPNVKTGKFTKGNIEFWSNDYSGKNVKKIPGANNDLDFGDVAIRPVTGYGSMQVHNYLEKQTVFAFNHWNSGINCDLGIGNNRSGKGKQDWTYNSVAGENYKNAELYVVGIFCNLKINNIVKLDPNKISLRGETAKVFYVPGEEMIFNFYVNYGDQPAPFKPYLLRWSRIGDDRKKISGVETVIPGKPIVVKTSSDQPGFVKFRADLLDYKGCIIKQFVHGRLCNVSFDGATGVEPEKLQSAVVEPVDFDQFWTKQKAKLDAVPLKYDMKKISKPGSKVEVYAVSIDCAGPRPVTGYLSIPADAKAKSLPALASYPGYGIQAQPIPKRCPEDQIRFCLNAHGYDLGKDQTYYKEFSASIKSNGNRYAFDLKQNSNPETAYFNGMALRVMRSLQFLKSLPQWNGKDLVVTGGSQGGLQAVWAAGLDSDVSLASISIVWCCDLAGSTQGRIVGWRPVYVPALNYYDAVFHAKRIKCPVVISRAGLGDYICPPSGLAILYNNLKSPKKIIWIQGSTHGFVPQNPQKHIEKGNNFDKNIYQYNIN